MSKRERRPSPGDQRLERSLALALGAREARWVLDDVGVRPGQVASVAQERQVRELAGRRVAGEPLQYVLGHWPFRGLDLLVDARVLIPRPETEWLTDVALAELDRLVSEGATARVVDLGTGTGAIALALATERHGSRLEVIGTDRDAAALELARANEVRVSQGRTGFGPVSWRLGSWWAALEPVERGTVALVVANPPYVSTVEWELLDPVVRDHEPHSALVAGLGTDGTPGLADIEAILTGAPDWLSRPGAAVIEIAPSHDGPARRAAERAGAVRAEVLADLAGRPRALVARWE